MSNNKTGFSYYNTDTDRYQDIRIKRLKKDFGCSGIAVYDYILCEIYRVKGCFTMWDESTAFDVAEYFGLKESLVNEIVTYCGVVGLFNKELLTRESKLTSHSIQTRFLEMSERAKRKNISIPNEINLLQNSGTISENSGSLPLNNGTLQENSYSLPQSRVEKSKEDKSKEKEIKENFYFDFLNENPEYLILIKKWIEYKKQISSPIETQMQLEAIYNDLLILSNNSTVEAEKIINYSIGGKCKNLYQREIKPANNESRKNNTRNNTERAKAEGGYGKL